MRIQTDKQKNLLFLLVGIVYLIPVAAAVAFSWLSGIRLFDLSLTVSLYIGLYRWSAVWFFIHIGFIAILMFLYVRTAAVSAVRKYLYHLITLCIFCCAWFPCNRSRSVLSSDIHDFFSYALVILLVLSSGLMTCSARNSKQRIFGAGSFVFCVFFVAAFVLDLSWFGSTVLIWENLLVILLFVGLYLEESATVTIGEHI